ncbi:hypothetical protein U27_06283 [Candidatus Vecturithrix granuli]|uniref:Uncharacterized protein n=1 Tax=Vecturithrix granuli TaxID=1499967 RepID=A0A081C401_VECG1|nr:hypothetical protein U27_06283 [Candidatus Vecturithrix granuli]
MVNEHKTIFGKYVLDSLTRSMYENPKTIYRELIQNSADAIDNAVVQGFLKDKTAGVISISIEKNERKIIIEDNGTGIKANDVLPKLMNIGDSDKDKESDKGFRGIGRLGALGYCERLIIETSYPGETIKNVVGWAAKELMTSLDEKNKEGAAELFQRVATRTIENEAVDTHYYRVILENVSDDSLLEKQEIKEYLSMVAPVPFDRAFILRNAIYEYVKKHNFPFDEYTIYLNTEQICKAYTSIIYEGNELTKKRIDEISHLEFFNFNATGEEPLLWGWYGISSFTKQIPEKGNLSRGLRLRKSNIQIGDSYCLVKLHKEQRGNFYFVGEIHALHPALYPNARRDYFFENHVTKLFEKKLRHYFHNELYNLYYFSSKVRSTQRQIEDFVKFSETYEEKSQKIGFKDKEEAQHYERQFETLKDRAEAAKKTLTRIADELTQEPSPKKKIFEKVTKGKPIEVTHITPPVKPKENKIKYVFDDLSSVSRDDRKLIARVFAVVDRCLPDKALVENIRLKIIEEFK